MRQYKVSETEREERPQEDCDLGRTVKREYFDTFDTILEGFTPLSRQVFSALGEMSIQEEFEDYIRNRPTLSDPLHTFKDKRTAFMDYYRSTHLRGHLKDTILDEILMFYIK